MTDKDEWPGKNGPIYELKRPRWYGNVPTLFGSPFVEKPAELEGADVVFLGIPWQGAVPDNRVGVAADMFSTFMTPEALRANSTKYGGYLPELDVDVFQNLVFKDYGNADFYTKDLRATFVNVQQMITEVLKSGAIPVTIGGNSGIASSPVIKAIADYRPAPIAIVNFDAHGDNKETSIEDDFDFRNPAISSGWALKTLGYKGVSPQHYQIIGLRGPRNDPGTIPRFLERGVPRENIYTFTDIKLARKQSLAGFDELAALIAQRATRDQASVWLAIDLDVMDMSVCPRFGDEPLGIFVDELVTTCYEVGRAAGRRRLAGISFMAVPPYAAEMQWIVLYTILYTLAGVIHANV